VKTAAADQRRKLDYPPPLESHGDEAVWLRDV
jgi:hypothetical protein